jgi:hypothetical protein
VADAPLSYERKVTPTQRAWAGARKSTAVVLMLFLVALIVLLLCWTVVSEILPIFRNP